MFLVVKDFILSIYSIFDFGILKDYQFYKDSCTFFKKSQVAKLRCGITLTIWFDSVSKETVDHSL